MFIHCACTITNQTAAQEIQTLIPSGITPKMAGEAGDSTENAMKEPLVAIGERSPAAIRSLAAQLFARIDFTDPELSEAQAFYASANYWEFLKATRNLFIDTLRKKDFGKFYWHESSIQFDGLHKLSADYLTGLIAPESALSKNKKYQGVFHAHMTWGLAGSPYSPISPDFNKETREFDDKYSYWLRFADLLSQYWVTEKRIYLDKWLQITAHYAEDFYSKAEKYKEEDPDARKQPWPHLRNDYDHWTLGVVGPRTDSMVKSFALIAKSLPGENTKTTDRLRLLQSIPEKPFAHSYDLVDPVATAKFLLFLERDAFPHLFTGYVVNPKNREDVPNKLVSGLSAMTCIIRAFDHFKSTEECKTNLDKSISAYITTYIHKDGFGAEQAFNYNIQDSYLLENLGFYLNEYAHDFTDRQALLAILANYRKAYDVITSPLGSRPNVGAGESITAGRAWESEGAWRETFSLSGAQAVYPGFTSIAFPYAGYYVLRSGWDKDDTHCFLQNARRMGPAGHLYPSNNSIELITKRRNMIMGGGWPYYKKWLAPDEFKEGWMQYNDYMGESSTLNRSTVVVDGLSQIKRSGSFYRYSDVPDLQPIRARWLDSDLFSYTEGLYDGGYLTRRLKVNENRGNSRINIPPTKGIDHLRQVIMVKPLDLIILSDKVSMPADSKHILTQQWCFPPFLQKDTDGIEVPGFKEHEVVYSEKDKSIETRDPSGPNVFLKSFASYHLTYKKYFGHKGGDGYRGWYSSGATSKMWPKVDMHINWVGNMTQPPLATLISTSNHLENPLHDINDLSTDTSSGFSITKDGKNAVFHSAECPTGFRYKSIELTAQLALLIQDENQLHGLVVDCNHFSINGEVQKLEGPSFAFSVLDEALINTRAITEPVSFKWAEGKNGVYPEYHLPESNPNNTP
jgi:hypothetical protein